MSEEAFDADLKAFETLLRSLPPSAGRLNRDRLMYQAGRLSARRRGWALPAATTALAAAVILLSGLLLRRPPAPAVEHVVIRTVTREVAATAPQPVSPPSPAAEPREAATEPSEGDERAPLPPEALRLRDLVLSRGLDALPKSPPFVPAEPAAGDDLFPGRTPGAWKYPALFRRDDVRNYGGPS
jgi:hypothetical protein